MITYKARDGVDVYARLFTPEMIGFRRDPSRPGSWADEYRRILKLFEDKLRTRQIRGPPPVVRSP